jgi:iron donor protein CyaY
MSNTDFLELAEEVLQNIASAIEEADSAFELDVDATGDSINIEFSDGSKYLINIHASSQEIWVSSPVSGACHFAYDEDEGTWKDANETDLCELVTEELEELSGISIRL